MPTPTKGPRLGAGPAHERLMLANLATSLFEHGRITTTETKAKRLRPLAERLITFARRGDLPSRRRVLRVIRDKSVVHTLFAEIGPRFAQRHGGYTRIVKIGPRKGDNAPMAVIELVEELTVSQEAVGEAEAATKRSAKDRGRDRGGKGGKDTKGAQAATAAAAAEQSAQAAEEARESGQAEDAVDAAADAEEQAEVAEQSATEAGVEGEAAERAEAAADAADQAAEGAVEDTKDENSTDEDDKS